MNRFVIPVLLWLAPGGLLAGAPSVSPTLRIEVAVRFGEEPCSLDEPRFATDFNSALSVSRLDFLVSGLALRRIRGGWVGPEDWVEYFSLREGRLHVNVPGFAAGQYDRIRFFVGLPPEANHGDPAAHAGNHPLNPNLNGLHWDWLGGYVFLALEGGWPTSAGERRGYSFHLGSDPNLMSLDLPLPRRLDLGGDAAIQLILDLRAVLGGPEGIVLSPESNSTHSRDGDPLAARLRRNVERAFRVGEVRRVPATDAPVAAVEVERPPGTHPFAWTTPRGFPPPELPHDNPLTVEGVALGRFLFHDTRLSFNGTQSCASCHQPSAAFTDPGRAVSPGAGGALGQRNAMSLLNLAWTRSFFWDGRAATLREQVLQPIVNPAEMGERLDRVVMKLSADDDARGRFQAAFASPEVTVDRIARALEQFLLTLVSPGSRFDRFLAGDSPLSADEERGRALFFSEFEPRLGQYGADCFHCHKGFLFKSQDFANNGLDAHPADPGRFLATGHPGDLGRFAVPSLRNVERTAPYMHDGRFATLEEAVGHYRRGVKRTPTLDPNLSKHPDGGVPFSDDDLRALVAFLKTLSDDPLTAPPTD